MTSGQNLPSIQMDCQAAGAAWPLAGAAGQFAGGERPGQAAGGEQVSGAGLQLEQGLGRGLHQEPATMLEYTPEAKHNKEVLGTSIQCRGLGNLLP